MLEAILVSILFGALAWVLLSIFPPTAPYANVLSLVVAILVFLTNSGVNICTWI